MIKLRSSGLRSARGFSLFEVLITVVVISIGLLGLAGLQFAGLKAINSAQDHTQAALLAQDIAERIHANPGASYNGISLDGSTSVSPITCNASNYCNPADMRNFDRLQWQQVIDEQLLANLQISIDHNGSAPTDSYTLTLTWGNSDDEKELVMSFKI